MCLWTFKFESAHCCYIADGRAHLGVRLDTYTYSFDASIYIYIYCCNCRLTLSIHISLKIMKGASSQSWCIQKPLTGPHNFIGQSLLIQVHWSNKCLQPQNIGLLLPGNETMLLHYRVLNIDEMPHHSDEGRSKKHNHWTKKNMSYQKNDCYLLNQASIKNWMI